MIQTVLGKIEKAALGKTLMHEHLILDLRHVRKDEDSCILDVEEVCKELETLREFGVASIVEVTTIDMHRNVKKLAEIAQKMKLNIICSTGYYLQEYHSTWLHQASVDDISEQMQKELLLGIDDTNIKAGLIAEIATSYGQISPSELKVFQGAAKASKVTGCAISTHCDGSTMASEQCRILLDGGVLPDKVILGHMDLNFDYDYQIKLLQQGVNLGFDTISKTKYATDEERAKNIKHLIDAGYEDHLVLSQDVSRKSYFTQHGGNGYLPAVTYFVDMLVSIGITTKQIEKLFVDNPARILNIKE